MALEDLTGSAKFISALNPAWPVDDDWVDEGDNHIRGIKNVLRNTFPNVDGAVTLSDEQLNTATKAAPDSRIINGNFAIDQRNAGASVSITTGTLKFAVDRWWGTLIGAGVFDMRRAVEPGAFYLLASVASVMTPGAGEYAFIGHKVEGLNLTDMKWGSAQAQPFTFACRIAVSVAGTYPIAFRNATASHSYVWTVTLPAGGWTLVTATIPGATTGVWNTDSGVGLQWSVGLGIGASFNAPVGNAWQSGNFMSVAGCTNLMATGASMYLADVRLYPGSIDYGPCQRLYADELRLCQRYYSKSYDIGTVPGTPSTQVNARGVIITMAGAGSNWAQVPLPVRMRSAPAVVLYSTNTGASGFWRTDTADLAAGAAFAGDNHFVVQNTAAATVGHGFLGHWTASAEL